MNIFEIIGPVMVGPSSSHTAGAARIGLVSRRLRGEKVVDAVILLHGSFAATGVGHGTDRALSAGLLGMACDDARIPDAFEEARKAGMKVTLGTVDLGEEAHPNSVRLFLKGEHGKKLEIVAASIGGGQIQIREIDGLKTVFSGDYPTLIVENDDRPGEVSAITGMLYEHHINIATVQLDRDSRGGHAVTVIECDQEVPSAALEQLRNHPGILKITYLPVKEETCTVH